MSITRINEFQARDGEGKALYNFLKSILPLIQESEGNISCKILQNEEDPTQIIVIEVWENKERHVASVKTIPKELLQEAMLYIAAPPKGSYYKSEY